jgi:predicted O-methyltransferase YrrM
MFHNIPAAVIARMQHLEKLDAKDRRDGTPRPERLRQIPPETGRFLAIMLAGAPQGAVLEIGTSAGYSTLWLSLACRLTDRQVTTFEILLDKIALAQETFRLAGVDRLVRLVEGDALAHLADFERVGFCFLDAEKEIYAACY